jgi:hypothetical protein
MAFKPLETFQGVVDFTNIDTSANRTVVVGTIARGVDAASSKTGGAEFIYLPGVASNIVGALVSYNPLGNTVTLSPTGASTGLPLAVSMTANTATTSYSWYQISGVATIKKTAVKVSPTNKLALSGTAGRVLGGSTAGKMLMNCISVNAATVASATSTVQALIQRPFAEPIAT